MKSVGFSIVFFLLVSIFLSTSCERDDWHYEISFVNKSGHDVFVQADWWYPDTAISFGNPARAGNDYKVPAKSSSDHPLSQMESYEKGFSLHTKFMVFVLDADVVKSTPWDTVVAKYLILKRYDLSLNDLDSMNWTITYP